MSGCDVRRFFEGTAYALILPARTCGSAVAPWSKGMSTCPAVKAWGARRWAAMGPPAPAVFSITSGWPSERPMRSPRMRAIVSVGPPAANGTTTVMGREGYAWAAAKVDIAASNAAPRTCRSGDVFMKREFTGNPRLTSRYGAFLIDVLFCLVLWFMGALMVGSVGFEFNRWNGIALLVAYFGLLPATPMQATPGKRAFGIKITDLDGKPLTVTRSMP